MQKIFPWIRLQTLVVLLSLLPIPSAFALQTAEVTPRVELSRGEIRVHVAERTTEAPELEIVAVRANTASGEIILLENPVRIDSTTAEGSRSSFVFSREGMKVALDLDRRGSKIITSMRYQGPALALKDSVQLTLNFPNFTRGLTLRRLNLFWTSPVIVSNFRNVARSNHLMVWRGSQNDRYFVLAPLAGGSMVSDIGVDEIEGSYRFRVAASSDASNFTPKSFPLFAFGTGLNPFESVRETFETAMAVTGSSSVPLSQKKFPEMFKSLGWCSWNAYEKEITESRILENAKSFRQKGIPVRTMLIDDGWMTQNADMLQGFDANRSKFPGGLAGLTSQLRKDYGIHQVGLWHAFQGYWAGIDPSSEIGRRFPLLKGVAGRCMADPRSAGDFYSAWYSHLAKSGIDFVKIDNQGNNSRFTRGILPLFDSATALQRGVQTAAMRHFGKNPNDPANLINCMGMSLENAFNWRESAVSRNSNDYLPDDPINTKDHVLQNAYNALWTSNFAYPDWDMFQTHDPRGEFHAIARAVSGGPIFFTDRPHEEKVEILRALSFSDGYLPRLDGPGLISREMLFQDPSIEALPLKVQGTVTRPGVKLGIVGVFNVNKDLKELSGSVRASDVEIPFSGRLAVFRRSNRSVSVLNQYFDPGMTFSLDEFGADVFTLAPVQNGMAVFGLADKYLGAAAIESVKGRSVEIREAGDFVAYLETAPSQVLINGKPVAKADYTYADQLLTVPSAAFGSAKGVQKIEILP